MRKFVLVFATLAFSGSAFAADMAVKAPPSPPAPAFSWTGFYVGGNIGYSWGDANGNFTRVIPEFIVGPVPFASSDTAKPNGVIGGAQVGYNWQAPSRWVFSLEADWQGSGQKSNGALQPVPVLGLLGTGTNQATYDAKIDWFGTARGRIGYAFDRILLYATGGLAYGEVKIGGTMTDSGILLGAPYSAAGAFSASKVNAGWTLGGGIEGAFTGNWSWKAEYLYLDLGSLDASAGLAGTVGFESVNAHTRFTDNIVRAGLNFRLGP